MYYAIQPLITFLGWEQRPHHVLGQRPRPQCSECYSISCGRAKTLLHHSVQKMVEGSHAYLDISLYSNTCSRVVEATDVGSSVPITMVGGWALYKGMRQTDRQTDIQRETETVRARDRQTEGEKESERSNRKPTTGIFNYHCYTPTCNLMVLVIYG